MNEEQLTEGREQLLALMSDASERLYSVDWAPELANLLQAAGGVWETLGRTYGWPSGRFAENGWTEWEDSSDATTSSPDYLFQVTFFPGANGDKPSLDVGETLSMYDTNSVLPIIGQKLINMGTFLMRASVDEDDFEYDDED